MNRENVHVTLIRAQVLRDGTIPVLFQRVLMQLYLMAMKQLKLRVRLLRLFLTANALNHSKMTFTQQLLQTKQHSMLKAAVR